MTPISAQRNTKAPRTKSEVAYAAIRTRIANRSYRPGYRLILEKLAHDLGVSTVPVREALFRLQAEGYVDVKPSLGATVATIDVTAYAETVQTMAIIEAAAIAIAAPDVDDKAIEAARALNDSLERSLDRLDPVVFSETAHKLHRLLYVPCTNVYLRDMVDREWDRLRGIRHTSFAFVPEGARQSVDDHTLLIDMVASGASSTEIEDLARMHRMRTANHFLHQRPLPRPRSS